MTRRILIVGENPSLETDFRSPFSAADCTWTAEFARTGAEAVGWVMRSSFDAVLANAQLPQLSGLEVLDQIAIQQPKSLRIIQTEINDTANTLQCIGRAHHHIVGPSNAATIAKLLHEALTMESWLPSDSLQSLLAQMRHVPSPPSLYLQITEELKSPEASIENAVSYRMGSTPDWQ